MSLAALNSPPLVATAGLGLGFAFPYLNNALMASPWSVVRVANLVSYGINIVSVMRPGRMDGEAAEDGKLSPRTGRTLVAPAGWAFAIWGPIFLGELVGVVSQFFIPESGQIVSLLKKTSAPFISAQLFQSLWCAAFRPKYKENLGFISAGLLSATAYSLSIAHSTYTSESPNNFLQYALFFLPVSLHFGWTTAASLVNLNGAFSMKEKVTENAIARFGHASVIGASILGIAVTIQRSAPVYGAVIAWALSAVADSMKKRLVLAFSASNKKKNADMPGIYGASIQFMLSRVGALLNAVTSVVVAASITLLANNSGKSMPTP
jgi:hypothetical protein